MSEEFYTWNKGEVIKFTNHFESSEFECNCQYESCIEQKLSKQLIEKLEEIRVEFGEPIWISSGCRCEKHNKAEDGGENSQHLIPKNGRAADLKAKNLDRLYDLCLQKFSAIGDGRKKGKFIHVDVRSLPKGKKGPITFGY